VVARRTVPAASAVAAAADAAAALEASGLTLTVTGPWPPYSFVADAT
jgi:hypothetical protein